MALPIQNTFVRRSTGHRTVESTCKRCFLTVAIAKRERELDQAEQRHICEPWLLEQWKQIFDYNPPGGIARNAGSRSD